MQSPARLQLVGPLVFFCAVLAAESAAYALAYSPSSELLWYLNLDVFSAFRRSRAALSDLGNVPFAQLLVFAGPTLLVGLAGAWFRQTLLLAISSNLSFCFAAFLAYNCYSWTSEIQVQAASLTSVYAPTGNTFWVFGILIATSVLSFGTSHFIYFKALRGAE